MGIRVPTFGLSSQEEEQLTHTYKHTSHVYDEEVVPRAFIPDRARFTHGVIRIRTETNHNILYTEYLFTCFELYVFHLCSSVRHDRHYRANIYAFYLPLCLV